MTIEIKKQGEKCQIAINDEMTIYTAALQKEELLGHLGECREVELDLSGVSEMDSAGLQLLVVLKSEAKHMGKDMHVINHSEAVRDVLELFNLVAQLGDPIIIPAEHSSS